MNAPLAARGRASRLLGFALESHPPATYVFVAGGWACSLMLLLQRYYEAPLDRSWGGAGVALAFFLILLYLRAVDEIKDYDYDRVHNPDRPLVRGAVSQREVAGFAAGVALVVLLLSGAMAPALAICAAAQMSYGLLLLWMERHWAGFREDVMLNLLLTFPVSATLNVYAWLYLQTIDHAPPLAQAWPAMVAHVAVFLHMEFGRKLKWPALAAAGENGYAQALGMPTAIAICALLVAGGVVLTVRLQLLAGATAPVAALPALALLPSLIGFARLLSVRTRVVALKPWFGGAMILYFLLNITAALLR